MSDIKPCPFCGEMLEKKHVRERWFMYGFDYYQHPDNKCILANVEDLFPITVSDKNVDDWNRRAET